MLAKECFYRNREPAGRMPHDAGKPASGQKVKRQKTPESLPVGMKAWFHRQEESRSVQKGVKGRRSRAESYGCEGEGGEDRWWPGPGGQGDSLWKRQQLKLNFLSNNTATHCGVWLSSQDAANLQSNHPPKHCQGWWDILGKPERSQTSVNGAQGKNQKGLTTGSQKCKTEARKKTPVQKCKGIQILTRLSLWSSLPELLLHMWAFSKIQNMYEGTRTEFEMF